jgi:nitric oxide reductase NorD protein
MGCFCGGVRVQVINSKQLNADEMEERLDEFLDPILSSRRTAASVAKKLAVCNYQQQEFVLHWVGVIAHTNAELAYQFANNVIQALNLMDDEGVEAWIIQAMDVYDKKGLHSAIGVLRAPQQAQQITGLPLEEIERILDTFIAGLSGRHLSLVSSEQVYTDTETLFLPALLNQFSSREDNFILYKAMAVHLWAQTRFGTWQKPFFFF